MTQHEQTIYLFGYIKANIELLCALSAKRDSNELFDLLADLEAYFNQEIKRIFA